jgi:hypothetical protein
MIVSGCHNLFNGRDWGTGLWKFNQAGKGKEYISISETNLRSGIMLGRRKRDVLGCGK